MKLNTDEVRKSLINQVDKYAKTFPFIGPMIESQGGSLDMIKEMLEKLYSDALDDLGVPRK